MNTGAIPSPNTNVEEFSNLEDIKDWLVMILKTSILILVNQI